MGIKQYTILKKIILLILSIGSGIVFGSVVYLTLPTISLTQSLFLFVTFGVGMYAIRSLYFSFCLFLATLPLHSLGALYVGTTIKLWYIFLFFFLLSILYTIRIKKEQREAVVEKIKTMIDIPLFLFFCIIILSVFQSRYAPPNPPLSWPKFMYYPWIEGIIKILILGGCFLVYYGVQYLLDTKEKIRKYVYTYGIFVIIFALYGIFALVWYILSGHIMTFFGQQPLDMIAGDIPRIMATEKEPLFFGLYLMTILPIFYALLIVKYYGENHSFYNHKIVLGGSIVLTIALLGTNSRSVILGFMFSLLTLFLIYKGERTYAQYWKDMNQEIKRIRDRVARKIIPFFSSNKGKAIGIICLLLISFLGVMYRETIKEGVEKSIISPVVGAFDKSYGKFWSTKTRLIAYEYALGAFKQHPWFGIGYESFNLYSGNKVYYGIILANVRWAEVNNYPLKVLTELGIVGFLFFLFLILFYYYYLIRAMKRTKDPFLKTVLQGYIASFVGISIILLFSSVIILPYLWVSMGIGMAIIREVEKENENSNKYVGII